MRCKCMEGARYGIIDEPSDQKSPGAGEVAMSSPEATLKRAAG